MVACACLYLLGNAMNLYIALVAGNVHNMIGWAMGGGGEPRPVIITYMDERETPPERT